MNQLKPDKQKAVLSALFEGASINSTVRMTGVAKTTILRLVRWTGMACAAYHDLHVRGLKPDQVQCDEIWGFIGAKAKNVREEREAEGWGDSWTWTAITDQKLIIAYHVGQRTQADADEFMLDLAGRITNRTQLTSDGHTAYLNAVENAFGFDVDYAQLVKSYGKSRDSQNTSEARYSPPKINGAKKMPVIGLPDREHISTSHVERSNLTIRMGMRRFTRLTNAHSKKVEYHMAAVAMFFLFYNYVRVHATLRTSPAVASGLTDHVWTLDELIRLLDE
jgi:IS1 family transposase